MRTRSTTLGLGGAAAVVLPLVLAGPVAAQQTPSMPSTLRYGTGLLDIPVSSVLQHLEVQGTYSGFFVSTDRSAQVDGAGATTGFGGGVDDFFGDASLAVGLFDRVETGVSLQSFGGASDGGDVWGLFGRVRLWEPIDQGVGLAVGGRYVTSPAFGDGQETRPARLGFSDPRLVGSHTGGTNLSIYGVATAYLRGFDGGFIPRNDVTFSLGWGSGMFAKVDRRSSTHRGTRTVGSTGRRCTSTPVSRPFSASWPSTTGST